MSESNSRLRRRHGRCGLVPLLALSGQRVSQGSRFLFLPDLGQLTWLIMGSVSLFAQVRTKQREQHWPAAGQCSTLQYDLKGIVSLLSASVSLSVIQGWVVSLTPRPSPAVPFCDWKSESRGRKARWPLFPTSSPSPRVTPKLPLPSSLGLPCSCRLGRQSGALEKYIFGLICHA